MTNKSQMPYTVAFMEEVFRFRTLAPLQLPHMATEDIKIDGFIIPKGTKVCFYLYIFESLDLSAGK